MNSICIFCVLRKREEEQRRRGAVQQIAVDKQPVPVTRTQQKTDSLVNVIENLTVSDSAGETKKSSKAERTKTKTERLKGRTPVVNMMMNFYSLYFGFISVAVESFLHKRLFVFL